MQSPKLLHKTNLIPYYMRWGPYILGKICPRSDPDIAHMKYSIDPLKLIVNQRAYDSGLLEFSHVKSPIGKFANMDLTFV